MNWETFRFEFDPDGTFRQRGRDGWAEPICPTCREPIRWVLDMFSFTNEPGSFVLEHARCAWTKNGFQVQEALAPDGDQL